MPPDFDPEDFVVTGNLPRLYDEGWPVRPSGWACGACGEEWFQNCEVMKGTAPMQDMHGNIRSLKGVYVLTFQVGPDPYLHTRVWFGDTPPGHVHGVLSCLKTLYARRTETFRNWINHPVG